MACTTPTSLQLRPHRRLAGHTLTQRLAAAGLAAGLLASAPALAYFPLMTDDTGTQGRGGHQLEFAYIHARDTNNVFDNDGRVVDSPLMMSNTLPITYTYGLTDELDVFVGVVPQTGPVAGWQNTGIGLKWNMAGDQSHGWSVGVKPSLLFPVSKQQQTNGLGNAATNWAVDLIGSYIGQHHELHLNVGYISNRYTPLADAEPQRGDLWSISAAPVLILNPQWKLALDVELATNPAYNSRYVALGQVAVIYAPIKNVQISLGLLGATAINATDNSRGWSVLTGVAWQF